ncbi:MAG: hypothetical protein ACR2IV_08820 [Bryobacteraceae bacterium]
MLAVLLLTLSALAATDRIDAFGYRWTVPGSSDWKIERQGSVPVLQLVTPRGPLPGPRRPIQFALAETPEYRLVTVDLDVRPMGHSLIVVFAYRDAAHFDYAHLSIDPATKEPVHNGVFHVYGGERVRISSEAGPSAFTTTSRWFHVRLTQNGKSGVIQVTVDGHAIPALHAIDLSLPSGRVGIGSFDETGDFKNVRIQGVTISGEGPDREASP